MTLRRSLLRLVIPLLAAGALAGCEDRPPADYHPHVSEEDKRFGAEQHPRLLAELGGSYDAPEATYVGELGARLSDAAGLKGQCTFTLVNSDVVNAFAVPGCYIYVTRGMLAIVNSEAELASVLGHELGHIVADHSNRQERRSLWRTLGVLAVGIFTGSDGLTQLAARAAEFFTLRYSRTQEYESDDLGIRYLTAAGYDPYAAADMLTALSLQEKFIARTGGPDEASSIPEWVRTHPLTENRIERARGEAAATGIKPDTRPENEAVYLNAVDGLLYGDDPQQGFVLGRRFLHPVMRIAFEAPDGFTLRNGPQAILIDGPEGIRGEFAGGPLPQGGLDAYVTAIATQTLGEAQAQPGQREHARIHGLPAVLQPMLVPTAKGEVLLTIAAYDGGNGQAYHFMLLSPPVDRLSGRATALFNSFRLLSPEEAARLRPRRIRVETAGASDNTATLAGRMATDHPLDTFLMLNGISRERIIRRGERVKIVTLADR